jgi:predicted NBD/HSP70 family sugar kinase
LRDPLAAGLGLPVQIENSGKACALAQLWATRDAKAPINFVYITVSDGLGVGIVLNGEVVRGQHNIAGEFGHVPLNVDGPRCGCGATGCWEAYVSNLATLSRYFGRDLRQRPVPSEGAALTVDDLIARARGGDAKALAALLSTARYLGLGLGSVVNAIDPSHVYIGGEITAAWDLMETAVRGALAERALTPSAGATPITIVPPEQYPRLRGAAALVAAPSFAGESVA